MDNIVLLVDDDDHVLHGLARVLRKQPYQLYTTRSADEAIATLKAHDVDVVVADERMPGMPGTRLLAWIADNFPNVVRIVLTGHATAEAAIRAINEGAVYQFLTKPCDEVRLAVTIRKALEHSNLLKENRRLLDKNRCQMRELERFNRDLEILTSIASRDLQPPLEAISRSCRCLGEQYQDILDPKARTLIDDALDAAAEVHRIVDDLLSHFRVEKPADTVTSSDSNRETLALVQNG